jgi:peptide/nickel transport system substrate-binding protein
MMKFNGRSCARCAAVLGLVLAAGYGAAAAEPQRGGTLEFAVDAEPGNYDCQANVSFAFLHPVAPHYSTLLKFDTAAYPQIVGDVAESWSVSPDKLTYSFKLKPNVLFHDGAPLTSADVKASYERIIHPPTGVLSVRQVDYAGIGDIDTPDPLTVVFHLRWPQAAMLENFASPWNCIYRAEKLAEDPQYPRTHILGTGPFVFVEHEKGSHWTGRRFDRYFEPGKPYLDGYRADFVAGKGVIEGLESGRIMAEFRSVSPAERDELAHAMGDRITLEESPWLIDLLLDFNTKAPPFNDARVRRALSLAINRWDMAQKLAPTTYLAYVGGLMRPGASLTTPEADLARLPGFSRDGAAARDEAKRLLAEAGVHDLTVTLTNRNVPMPYGPAAQYIIESWKAIGVETREVKLSTKDWEGALQSGKFEVAVDFGGDYFDDPTLQLAKYVSRDLSPSNYSGATDRFLDALYIGEAITTDPRERVGMVRDFERRALDQANVVPILWWNRIVALSSGVKGWNMTPSHYIGQDLADVWLVRGPLRAELPPPPPR